MQWSQLKKRIEGNFADPVRDRIAFHAARYGITTQYHWRMWIEIDGVEVLDANTPRYERMEFIFATKVDLSGEELHKLLNRMSIFSREQFMEDMFDYLNYSIDEALLSERPVMRALAMLDKRLGKRRLIAMDLSKATRLVKRFYALRCCAEGIIPKAGKSAEDDLTTRIEVDWREVEKSLKYS